MTTKKKKVAQQPPTTKTMFNKMNKAISDKQLNQAVLILASEINAEICSEIMGEIIQLNFMEGEERPDIINLMITSNGGDMDAAIALIHAIRGSTIPVRTIAVGKAASAALCILMAGTHRVITPWTMIMSHQFSCGVEGNYTDLKTAADEFNRYHKKMVDIYATFTKLPKARIEQELLNHKDVYMTPEEAVKYGIADIICGLE